MRLVVVGATGAVGSQVLDILEQRAFPFDDWLPVASARSAGKELTLSGRTATVVELQQGIFSSDDLVIFDLPDDLSRAWVETAVSEGATVVDNSAAFRMDPEVPLVVPEINPGAARNRPRGIVANPNCTTLAMVVPIAALHAEVPVRRLILASYQAASGSGKPGIDELWEQTVTASKDEETVRNGLAREFLDAGETFPHPIALNVIPRCGSWKNDGYTSEELKLCNETRKIMDLPDLPVTATCVRVPVVTGHGVAVHAEFAAEMTPDAAREILSNAAGVEVVDDPDAEIYPTPLEAAGKDPCYVGRIRQDLFDPKALEMFCVADNLRKGAALNSVQIAELLLDEF
ncbi:MAG: aspartate-semialdehyde dehydrogenase [Actinomycetota bacterium]